MKPLSAFYSRVLPFLPGCPEPIADQALLSAAIEFAESSLVLRQDLDPFYSVTGYAQYDLEPPTTYHDITRVLGVTVGADELQPGLAETIRGSLPTASATPTLFYTSRADNCMSLFLSPPPDKAQLVVVNAALRPKQDTTHLDDDLYNQWIEPIVAGAIARAMQIPDQAYTNFARAQELLMLAARRTKTARIEGMYGRVRGSMRVQPRPFA